MRSVFSKSFGAGKLTISEKEIVEIVGRYPKDKHPGGANLEALPQGVRHEQDWWYVSVRPSVEPENCEVTQDTDLLCW